MNASPLEKVLTAVGDHRKSGNSFKAKCPAHQDLSPSLSISTAEDGKVLLKCHAGCTSEDIFKALGLKMCDLFPRVDVDTTSRNPREKPVSSTGKRKTKVFPSAAAAVAELEEKLGRRSAWWTYKDSSDNPVVVVVRWDTTEGKTFRPVAKDDKGWRIGDPAGPWPLYRLPELLRSSGPIYITEGEKAADALSTLGFTVTTSAHGARAAKGTDWSPLAGREVVILPDNDDAGAGYAQDIIDILNKLTPKPTIKIVNLPDLSVGGDVVDFIAGRKEAAMNEASIGAEIQKLKDAAVTQLVAEEPDPLAYQPFPVDLLPEPIRGYVLAGAAAIGCDPAFIALSILAAAASAIGNSRRIRLKRVWTGRQSSGC